MKLKDLTGQKFERLLVISRHPKNNNQNKPRWICVCSCGTSTIVDGSALIQKNTMSCGCLNKELVSNKIKTHGLSKTPEYEIWQGMKARCYQTGHSGYKNYGGRGIKVCNRWLNSFENFLKDIGNRPSNKHSIDRIDVNKDYCPENCKWSTKIEQGRNMRKNKFYTIDNQTLTIADWSRLSGVSYTTILYRLKNNWSIKDAVFTLTKNKEK